MTISLSLCLNFTTCTWGQGHLPVKSWPFLLHRSFNHPTTSNTCQLLPVQRTIQCNPFQNKIRRTSTPNAYTHPTSFEGMPKSGKKMEQKSQLKSLVMIFALLLMVLTIFHPCKAHSRYLQIAPSPAVPVSSLISHSTCFHYLLLHTYIYIHYALCFYKVNVPKYV